MALPVGLLAPSLPLAQPNTASGPLPVAGRGFAEHVQDALDTAIEAQQEGSKAAQSFADGKQNDLHGTMIAVEQADITLRLVANVRSRVVEAYREVMRMGA